MGWDQFYSGSKLIFTNIIWIIIQFTELSLQRGILFETGENTTEARDFIFRCLFYSIFWCNANNGEQHEVERNKNDSKICTIHAKPIIHLRQT